eukprot:57795-Rhodomonas_salina.1
MSSSSALAAVCHMSGWVPALSYTATALTMYEERLLLSRNGELKCVEDGGEDEYGLIQCPSGAFKRSFQVQVLWRGTYGGLRRCVGSCVQSDADDDDDDDDAVMMMMMKKKMRMLMVLG